MIGGRSNSGAPASVAGAMRSWLTLLVCWSSLAHAEELRLSLNGTVSGHWVEGLQVSQAREHVTLNGGGAALGASVDLVGRIERLRLGGQLAVDALEDPRGDLEVLRSAPLVPNAFSTSSVATILFIGVSPFVGLALGDEQLAGWLDLLLSLEIASARLDGERYWGVTPVPVLRIGGAVDVGGVGIELSLLGAFIGAPRVTLAMGVRL